MLVGGLLAGKAWAQVGTTLNTPDKTAALDLRISATGVPIANKGLLIPQVNLVSLTDGVPIVGSAPATGLLVYNTNTALAGSTGFYYWERSKWNKLIGTEDVPGDNLGNHIATQALNMSGFNITEANKTTTQTEAIALGTDGIAPQAGNVAMAADAQGNIVWKPLPKITTNAKTEFTAFSTGTSAASGLNNWVGVPGLSGYSYTAPKNGYLLIKATVYVALDNLTSSGIVVAMFQTGLRFTASVGGIVISDPRGTAVNYTEVHASSNGGTVGISGKNPIGLTVFTQFPVTVGTTYTLKLETADLFKYFSSGSGGGNSIAGSFTALGGAVLTSNLMGTFMSE